MVTRRTRVAVLVTDADEQVLQQFATDPQARQLLRWFEMLSPTDRADVHDLARCRQAGHGRPSFEVIPLTPTA